MKTPLFSHVAKQRCIDEPTIPFSDEHSDCMALLLWDLDQAFRAQRRTDSEQPALPGARGLAGSHADTPAVLPVRERYLLRNDLGLPRTLVVVGGCGTI